jgi:hypothetical protein
MRVCKRQASCRDAFVSRSLEHAVLEVRLLRHLSWRGRLCRPLVLSTRERCRRRTPNHRIGVRAKHLANQIDGWRHLAREMVINSSRPRTSQSQGTARVVYSESRAAVASNSALASVILRTTSSISAAVSARSLRSAISALLCQIAFNCDPLSRPMPTPCRWQE